MRLARAGGVMVTSAVNEMTSAYNNRGWLLRGAIVVSLFACSVFAYLSFSSTPYFLNGFVVLGLAASPFICVSFASAYLIFCAWDHYSGRGLAVGKSLLAAILALFWGFWLLA